MHRVPSHVSIWARADARAKAAWYLAYAVALATLAIVGCGSDEGTPTPNFPPQTTITSSVPNSNGRESVHHMLTIEFSGTDVDGTVVQYEYLVHTYPRSVASFDEIVVPTPADGDPRWTKTNAARSELVVIADTLRADPRGDIGDGRHDRWHTFFVRAIDNEGLKDPEPPARTFNAWTTGPEMVLLAPTVAGQVYEVPVTFALRWDGFDDGLNDTTRDPRQVRWALVSAPLDASDQPVGFPDALYDLPEPAWTAWIDFRAVGDAGREARLFDVIQARGDSTFVFAVQGRDDAGASTPQFKTEPFGVNNIVVVKARSDIRPGPALTLTETLNGLGTWTFAGAGAPDVTVDAGGATSVIVAWGQMSATDYGGRPGDYRYGWNVQDPNQDGEWTDWENVFSVPSRSLVAAVETLRVQARDNLGTVTTATLHFVSSVR